MMHCAVNCWISGEHGDREYVSNGDVNLINAWYIQVRGTTRNHSKTPLDYQYTLKKNEGQEGKIGLFLG
jgi:hypothetical protein